MHTTECKVKQSEGSGHISQSSFDIACYVSEKESSMGAKVNQSKVWRQTNKNPNIWLINQSQGAFVEDNLNDAVV